MPSVVVSWGGTRVDSEVQESLIGDLMALAVACRARFELPAPQRPAFLEKVVEMESKGLPELPLIIEYDQTIEGDILVDPNVMSDPSRSRDDASRLGVPWISAGLETGTAGFVQLRSVRVRGIDFRLFDPRGIYPFEDRISFVFLGFPEFPAIDGRICQVVDRNRTGLYQSEAIRSADWLVTTPSLHLRYYLEDWSDQLFSWVKYFFIPDFTYWRHETLSGFERARQLFDETVGLDSKEPTRRKVLALLLDWFNTEADDWTGKMATW